MLRVVCVVDKVGTALDRLAKGVAKYHDNIEYFVCDVHPKRPSQQQLIAFHEAAKTADLIDAQYYKSMEMLRQQFDWLKDIPTILTHNNPYAVEESDWNTYAVNVANNNYIKGRLEEITHTRIEQIPLTVDTDFWTYNTEWEPNRNVIMVANRIESKKGILEVAIACKELDLNFILVGAISDPGYFHAIEQAGFFQFYEQVSDEKLRELYYNSTIHVCNSKDNFESGTLPILEAMLCGVPVLTRRIGHVPELYNGENMVINDADYEDPLAIKDKLFEMMADKKKLKELRDKAWQTAKGRSHERRAYMYQQLYRSVLHDDISVSVVIPTYERPEILQQCLEAVEKQTHKNIEIIVADDNPNGENKLVVSEFAKYTSKPVRYLNTSRPENDYGLARARNEATIVATGEVMVYIDQRMIPEPDAVEEFLRYLKPKYWLYGNKGHKKEFVENFTAIYRQDVINAGLFSERMNMYGGMSQEIRSRIRNQGIQTEYVESAKCNPKGKSGKRNQLRSEIIKSKNRLWQMGLE